MNLSFLEIIKSYPYITAPLFGIIPALFWLWFWIQEDEHPEPYKRLALSFIMGMCIVFVVLPIQKLVSKVITDTSLLFILWASIEEIFKFTGAWLVGIRSRVSDEPIDPIIYLIATALGFVSLENTLFLLDPLLSGHISEVLITGNMRFIGASLLHIISSSTVGIFVAFSFYKPLKEKIIYGLTGLILAILLHTYFNLFIMNASGNNLFFVFAGVWLCIIVLMLIFEKIKHIIPKQ